VGTTYSVQVDGAGGAKGAVSIGVTFVTTVPAPANDLFSNAVTTLPATGTTVGASLETGEPLAGTGASGSVWYRFTAQPSATSATVSERDLRVLGWGWRCPLQLSSVVVHGNNSMTGLLLLAVTRSHGAVSKGHVLHVHVASVVMSLQVTLVGSSFDTLLAVYTGSTVTALALVANNDDCATGGSPASCTTFNVVSGTVYSVQVDGWNGQKGAVAIAVTQNTASAPPNDLFSNAVTTLPATGTTVGATLETGEPPAGTGASGSVWYRFTAPVASTSATVRGDDME
jgi:hypothetical protein